jgi:hypothetical protein
MLDRFNIVPSHKGDSEWAVTFDGRAVAWFSGTNAAERWIAVEKQIMVTRRRAAVSNAEARRIHMILAR